MKRTYAGGYGCSLYFTLPGLDDLKKRPLDLNTAGIRSGEEAVYDWIVCAYANESAPRLIRISLNSSNE